MAGHFYAIGGNGSNGKFGDSADGLSWTVNSPGTLDTSPTGFAYSPTLQLFISGGTASTINRASDGHGTWSGAASEPFPGSTRMCSWSPELSLFIAGGEGSGASSAVLASSTDGSNFTSRITLQGSPRGAVWVSSIPLWVAACSASTSAPPLNYATSPDGITWTARLITGSFVTLNDVAWSPTLGLFAMVGRIGSNAAIWTSPDGTTWTSRTATALGTNHVWAVCWSETVGKFVAGGLSGDLGYSSDGVTWTAATSPFGGTAVNGIAYGAGLFVAVGDSGKIASSSDGITWTLGTSGFSTTNITEIIWVESTNRGLVVRGQIIYR